MIDSTDLDFPESEQTASIPGGGPAVKLAPRWSKLGVTIGWDPTPVQRVCMWISGEPGAGKTNFVNGNPRALVLDFEDKSRDVIRPKAHRVTITDYDAFKSVFDGLLDDSQSSSPTFGHVVFDSIDQFRVLVIEYLTAQYNEHSTRGKIGNIIRDTHGQTAYDKIQEHIVTDILLELYSRGYGWSVVGRLRERETTVTTPGGKDRQIIVTRAAISDSLLVPIYGAADVMTHIVRTYSTFEREVPGKFLDKGRKHPAIEHVKEARVVLQLEPADMVNTVGPAGKIKARYLEYLPDQLLIPLKDPWGAYATAYEEALQCARDDLKSEESKQV